jgi:electron transport complex protein RnfB
MDPMSILFPVLSVGGMGVVFGACLGVASEVFKVEEDPRIGQVLECLPGANCGGCGFPGCGGCASAIVAGTAPVNACPVAQQLLKRLALSWVLQLPLLNPLPLS